MLFGSFNHRHHPLAVDDWLNFVDDVGVDLLLDDGLALNDTSLTGGGLFMDVLLNVVHDVVIH